MPVMKAAETHASIEELIDQARKRQGDLRPRLLWHHQGRFTLSP
jgi:hypothetical protein